LRFGCHDGWCGVERMIYKKVDKEAGKKRQKTKRQG
jgi:hypothetical protein